MTIYIIYEMSSIYSEAAEFPGNPYTHFHVYGDYIPKRTALGLHSCWLVT